jgi:hypothetical protein
VLDAPWTAVTRRPVLRSYQVRFSSSVALPSCTTRLLDKSSGPTSPRFSRHNRMRAVSSTPMMIRASEPPMKARRSIRHGWIGLGMTCSLP